MTNKALSIDEHIVLAHSLKTAQDLISRIYSEMSKAGGRKMHKSINDLGIARIRCEEILWAHYPEAGMEIYHGHETWQEMAAEDMALAKYRLDKVSKIAKGATQ